MVKASGNIFFNVNTANFSITAPDTEVPTAPTLSANNTASTKDYIILDRELLTT